MIGGALLCIFIHLFLKLLRYQYILIQQGVRNPFLKTVHFSLAAIFLGFVTPGRVGEISRAYFMHKAKGSSLNKLLAGILIDRIFDVYTLSLTALLGFAVVEPVCPNTVPIILLIVVIALIPLVFLTRTLREMLISLTGRIQRKITNADAWSTHLGFFFLKLTSC